MKSNTIGIDVSKAKLDICFLMTGEFIQTSNDYKGFNKLKKIILKSYNQDPKIIIEHTGAYQRGVVKVLQLAGWDVCVVNPGKVRNFAKAKGYNAKTDKIDAKVLAEFGVAMQPLPSNNYGQLIEEIRDMVRYKQSLSAMITEEKNRLEKNPSTEIAKMLMEHTQYMKQKLKNVKEKIKELICSDEILRNKREILLKIKGVGEETISTLFAEMPELGSLSKGEVASLAGLAPFNVESGAFKGKRRIKRGRKQVRNAIYMAALSAKRFNPILKTFYEKMIKRGKPYKVAITAVMRKLMICVNAKCKLA